MFKKFKKKTEVDGRSAGGASGPKRFDSVFGRTTVSLFYQKKAYCDWGIINIRYFGAIQI